MSWYTAVLKKYAVFSGRARRKEYWMFVLFNIFFSIILGLLDFSTGLSHSWNVLSTIYGLFIFIPSLAVEVRRLHDIDRTGWWILICLIPVVGDIIFLIFMITDSYAGDNRYGPNPKTTNSTFTVQNPTY